MHYSNYGIAYEQYQTYLATDEAIARHMIYEGFTLNEIAQTIVWSKDLRKLIGTIPYCKEDHRAWSAKVSATTVEFLQGVFAAAEIEGFDYGKFRGWLDRPWEKLED